MFSQNFSQFLFVLQLLFYSAIASAVIKYILPNWPLLTNNLHTNLNIDVMNEIAFCLITIPVAFFAFVLWLER
jgi:hypothetical protein